AVDKSLYMFVDNFSGAQGEEFFEKELPYLCAKFKQVSVIPLYPQSQALSYSAPNLRVLDFDFFAPCNRLKIAASHFFEVIAVFIYELRKTHDRVFYLKNFKRLLNQLLLTFSAADRLKQLVGEEKEAVLYTYWFKQWTAALCLLKLQRPG